MSACRVTGLLGLLLPLLLPLAACQEAGGTEGARPMADDLAKALGGLDVNVLGADQRARRASMLEQDAQARLRQANRRDAEAWAGVQSRAEWERFRDIRIKALRESLGPSPPGAAPPSPKAPRADVTRTVQGDGFRIENLVFESRPGLPVTANLYAPDPPRADMPGILICHSHHNPKTQEELQDMGATWAPQGCLVLVIDQIGHGERRQQPYPGREEYRSRYHLGMQLHLAGESLMGWMAWDLVRGLDLLTARPGVDPRKIILLGSVAGGGDPAAVVAALDRRVSCVVPFNFGGPQPETRYPLPPDAEASFNYAGSGSFESTRNLRLSARDGFLPYVIVAAAAPRCLIHAHEFAWDAQRDPVWKRFQRVYGFYDAADRLAAAHGWGAVTLKPPEASHCNNIGPAHRKLIYPLLERWFGIPAPKEEHRQRRKAEELACLNDEMKAKYGFRPVHELARGLAAERARSARAALARMALPERRAKLRQDWAGLLGDIELKGPPTAEVGQRQDLHGVTVERIVLAVEADIAVPMLILHPASGGPRPPVVVCLAQKGKQDFLRHRAADLAAALRAGLAVCLPDVRGTGETDPGYEVGRHNRTVGISSTELMLGQTLLGRRLRDVRAVLQHLRTRSDVDGRRVALWGEGFAPVNVEPFDDPPQDTDNPPHEAQPLGGLLALFAGLYEDDVRAVLVRRSLVGFESLLHAPFVYVPHDVIVPGALTAGDLCDVVAGLADRPVRIEGMVGGRNVVVSEAELRRAFGPAIDAYAAYTAKPDRLMLAAEPADETAAWLAAALRQ